MPLYGTFLARIPPGSPRRRDWAKRARAFECAGFFFGDYDLHGLVRLNEDVSLEHTEQLLRLAPDHRLILIASVPGEEDSRLDEAWGPLSKEYPLFCYFELGLQPEIMGHSGAILTSSALFVREYLRALLPRVEGDCDRKETDRIFVFLGFSASDVVVYLFGNDLNFFFDAALGLRRATVGDFARWLEADAQSRFHSQLPAIQKIDSRRPFCRTTYSLYGILHSADQRSDDPPNEVVDAIARKVDDTPTDIRPVVFLSTVPGHEKDNRQLHETLTKHSIGRSSIFVTNGLFDLEYPMVDSSIAKYPQNEIVRNTLLLLYDLWEEMGPKDDGRTKLLRTNTVWSRPQDATVASVHGNLGQNSRVTVPPTSDRLAERISVPATTFREREPYEPAARVIAVLQQAFTAIAGNHLAPSYAFIKDLGPFMEELRVILDERIQMVRMTTGSRERAGGMLLAQSHEGRLALRALDDVLGRLGLTLMTRAYCTTHALREEIAALPGASFHKLLAIYTVILDRIAARMAPLLGTGPLPRILCTLGGVRPARAHWYFRDESRGFRLAIFEVAGTSLLSPQRVIFSFAHELMHIVVETPAGRRLLDCLAQPLMAEAAADIANEAIRHGLGPPGVIDLEGRILANLVHDYHHACAKRGLGGDCYDVAVELVQSAGDASSYLRLLLQEVPQPGSDPEIDDQQTIRLCELKALEQLGAHVAMVLGKLIRTFAECAIDVLAACATSPTQYSMVLKDLGTMDAIRVSIVQATLRLCTKPPASNENEPRPLVHGLVALARRAIDSLPSTDDSLHTLMTRLSKKNMTWNDDEDFAILLQFFRETT